MYRARRVDEFLGEAVKNGVIPLPVHLSIGQEAVSVGVCMALKGEDIVFGTYRGHALYIAKGGNLKKMFAELWGKSTGCAQGKRSSMHLHIDQEQRASLAMGAAGRLAPKFGEHLLEVASLGNVERVATIGDADD